MSLPEHKLKIGYFGKRGSNTELAAMSMHGGIFKSYPSIPDLFRAVMDGEQDHGVVPIENSVEGSVGITNDLLYRDSLYITAESYLRITHCLIARPGTDIQSIRNIISHPQALGQCSGFISRNGWAPIPFPDTASAVSALSDERYSSSAAIASGRAAEIYGMEILQRDVGDFPDNYTRFVSVSRELADFRAIGKMKASVVVALEDRPGSLKGILEIYHRHDVNLTRIESRPVKFAPWRYIFFLDSEYDKQGEGALNEVRELSSSFKLLGIYPMGEL